MQFKFSIYLPLILFYASIVWSQPSKVDYTIACTLNDSTKSIAATMNIRIQNNSTDTLNHLYFHTWMNAFSSSTSDYVNQMKKNGDNRWYTLKSYEKGGYKNLEFYTDQLLHHSYVNKSKEIVKVDLKQPILPASLVSIQCDYSLDLPKNISRGGYIDKDFYLCQWYPKLALFDSAGWYSMNYLEYGEYFNEFGDYNITIDLPSNYIVAATGVLKNKEECDLLLRYADSCKKNMTTRVWQDNNLPGRKQLQYIANQVTDFAWSASKNYIVNHDTLLTDHRVIDIWSYFLPKKITLWPQATSHVKKAIRFFSAEIDEYPFGQYTVVENNKNSLDGMEYPMLSIIDGGYTDPAAFESTIVHEVGHSWFQGILSSNERSEPWLDEGVVSYYENKYARQQGIRTTFLSDAPFPLFSDYENANDFEWYLQAQHRKDQIGIKNPIAYSAQGYARSVYYKPANGLEYIKTIYTEKEFSSVMKKYYDLFKFNHPKGADLIHLFKSIGANWFEPLYINSAHKIDVRIQNHKSSTNTFYITQNLPFTVPIKLSGYKKDKILWTKIAPASNNSIDITYPPDSLDYIVADAELLLPELKRTNNILRISNSPFVPKKIKWHVLPGIGHSLSHDIYLHPLVGYNKYDGIFPGLSMHNMTLPKSDLLFAGSIGYGFNSKKIVPLFYSEYSLYPKNNSFIHATYLSFEYKKLSQQDGNYSKWSPTITLELSSDEQTDALQQIQLSPSWIRSSKQSYNSSNTFFNIQYSHENKKHVIPHHFIIGTELNKNFRKIFSHYHANIPFRFMSPMQSEIHFFAGYVNHKNNTEFVPLSLTGTTDNQLNYDYTFREYLLGRNEFLNKLGQQIFYKDAGFRSLANAPLSKGWLISASYRLRIHDFIPLRPYVQLAYGPRFSSIYCTSGISLVVLKDILEVNLPIFENRNLKVRYTPYHQERYWHKINFLFNINELNPRKWIYKLGR